MIKELKQGILANKKRFIGLILTLVLLISLVLPFAHVLPASPVYASVADAYWVKGTGNWSDATHHWASSSNGTPGAANLPASTTNAHFNAASFNGTGQIVTVDVAAYCQDMNFTGATNYPTLRFNNTENIYFYRDVILIANMTINTGVGWTWGDFSAEGSGAASLKTNGLSFPVAVLNQMDASGTLSLVDDLNITGQIQPRSGIFITNNHNITCIPLNDAGSSTPKTLRLGSSTINCTGWSFTGSGALTLDSNTATINIDDTPFPYYLGNVFDGGGATTYYNVNLNGATHTISGNNTFTTLTLLSTIADNITFTAGSNQTITTANLSGSSGHIHTLQSSSTNNWTITKTGGGYASENFLSISHSTGSPATYTWYAGANSTDGGNNTGWFFTAPPVIPTVVTNSASSVSYTSATLSGNITNTGGDNATTEGFEWGTVTNTYTSNWTQNGSYGISNFTHGLTGLSTNTTYYYKAMAINNAGWGYGGEQSFTTLIPTANLTPTSNAFGTLVLGSTSNTTLNYFTVTNTCTVAIDVTIQGADLTGSGDTWTLSDNATVGDNIYGLKAGLNGGSFNIIVEKSVAVTLVSNLAASANQSWGLEILMPSALTGGHYGEMTSTITLVASAH